MALVEFVTPLHTRAKRDYLARVTEFDKAHCSKIASLYGKEYWDGERQYGYGGYKYDGRWSQVAAAMIKKYGLTNKSKILDVGCGKGYLLYEFTQLLPGCQVAGVDISQYAIDNAKPEIKQFLVQGDAKALKFEDKSFDLVITNMALHNLKIFDLFNAVKEIQRVSSSHSWICVESYRNIEEKVNLLYWQLTCQSFYSTDEWQWIYQHCGFTGDYEFVFFE